MIELIGRLHPLVVHLPIGILLLAIFFEWLPEKENYIMLKKSVRDILAIGAVTAVFSSLTGFVLSQSGDYEPGLVDWHQWIGISLTVYTVAYAWMRRRKEYKEYRKTFSIILLGWVTITGHLGGTLTHGEGYLGIGSFSNADLDLTKVNLQQAVFYDDLVRPIFESRCYTCHGPSKQKGKLRLDNPEHITKGGEDGQVLIAGRADESDMIIRLLLPRDHEDHMPPKEKKQLTDHEIEILKAWISSGADFKKSVIESKQLETLQKIISSKRVLPTTSVPEKKVSSANPETITGLIKTGVVITPVAKGSNYLSANLINVSSLDTAIHLLAQVQEQLIWLKSGGQPVTDSHITKLATLTNLTRLSLDSASITDDGLSQLKSLSNLCFLNLNYTHVTLAGLNQISALKKLQSLYIYKTGIKAEEQEAIRKLFPATTIEIGNYQVPFLPTDTVLATAPLVK